jgi:hypothetical protein
MPTNLYVNNFENKPEQKLVNDLLEEVIKFHGIDVSWIPRKLISKDELFGEDTLSQYTNTYLVEMYIKNIEGFEGEGDFLSRFGLDIRDQLTLTLSQRRFADLGSPYPRPREGDLIFFPLNKKLFEIKFVEHELPFYPMGTLPVYELRCELFVYGSEVISTGISEIDIIETQHTYANTDIDSTVNETVAAATSKPGDDNINVETAADAILDFSDSNPFGTF